MKKIFFIVLVNLILIFIIIFSLEVYYTIKWTERFEFEQYKKVVFKTISVNNYFNYLYNKQFIDGTFSPSFRTDLNTNNKETPSILYMGCSFTYGDGLEENQTISYKTAELTNRPVYNRAGRGWGLAQLLYQLTNKEFYSSIPITPKYLIYVYIDDHLNRLNKFKIEPLCRDFQPKYKYTEKGLKEEKPSIFDRLVFVQYFQYRNNKYSSHKEQQDTIRAYFKQSKYEMQKHWKDTKFVILWYPIEYNDIDPIFYELEKEGFVLIDARNLTTLDLVDKKNKVDDGWHPAANVWEDIVPNLVKKLNL